MARDRQRAKQRKARRAERTPVRPPAPQQPRHEDVPGSLEHASGEVEEVDAALIAGAGGEPAEGERDDDGAANVPDLAGEHPEELSDEDFDEVEDEVDEAARVRADGGRDAIPPARTAAPRAGRPDSRPGADAQPTRRGGGRLVAFLGASWAELQRVQWPDRRQVGQATAVVMGFVIVAGAYLGLADQVAKQIVDFIL